MENELISEVLSDHAALEEGDRIAEAYSEHATLMGTMAARYLPSEDELLSAASSAKDEIDRRFLCDLSIIAPRAPWIGTQAEVTDEQMDKWANRFHKNAFAMIYPPVGQADIHSYKGFRPLSDQVLVRPLPAQDRVSSASLIVIPGNHDRGRLDNKLGVVLAIGPGDPVTLKCEKCGGTGNEATQREDIPQPTEIYFLCMGCDGTGYLPPSRTPLTVSVGDTVLYAPRGWAEIEIGGETLAVLHDCQHVLAVVDTDAVLFTEDSTTKKKGPDWVK